MLPLSGLSPHTLRRYREFAKILLKHGRRDVTHQLGLDRLFKHLPEGESATKSSAEELASDLERLGPTFIKLAQVLSSRSEMLPEEYRQALARLQDSAAAAPFKDIKAIIETDFGRSLSELFSDFKIEPLAAASLGQVHRATLHSGDIVAVKVQRPGVESTVRDDFAALEALGLAAERLTHLGSSYHLAEMVRDAKETVLDELNYHTERRNLEIISERLSTYKTLCVPKAIPELCSRRVITMEYIDGVKVTEVPNLELKSVHGEKLLDELFAAYLQQILLDGFFHADPHPGNVLLTSDGRLALLDLGMVCRVSPERRYKLLSLLLAIGYGRGEEAADVAIQMGVQSAHFAADRFRSDITRLVVSSYGRPLEQLNFGELVLSVGRIAAQQGLQVPRELTLIGKVCANLEETARHLDSQFDPNEAIRKNSFSILQRHILSGISPSELLIQAAEIKEFLRGLPRRLNYLAEGLLRKRFEIKIDAIDERWLIDGFQKVANRITLGLVIAAMIIGASSMMDSKSEWTILGSPALPFLMLIFAALIGAWLVIAILWNDVKPPDD